MTDDTYNSDLTIGQHISEAMTLIEAHDDQAGNTEGLDGAWQHLELVRDALASVEKFAEAIALAIAKQTDIDNLGDAESIVFMNKVPALNLNQLVEAILAWRPHDNAPPAHPATQSLAKVEENIDKHMTRIDNAIWDAATANGLPFAKDAIEAALANWNSQHD